MASRRMHAGYLQMSELAIGGQGVQGSFGSACFHPFFALCRSALVGVPRTTGRQPTQNGELHVFSRFSHSAILGWLASRCFLSFLALCHSALVGVPCTTGRQPTQNGELHVFLVSRHPDTPLPRHPDTPTPRHPDTPTSRHPDNTHTHAHRHTQRGFISSVVRTFQDEVS